MPNLKHTFQHYLEQLDDKSHRNHRLTLGLILLCGFLLRFYSLYVGQAYTYFAINDEVTALQYAFGFMAGDHQMLYLGSPALNQGHIPGPLWAMLVAGLYILGSHSAEGAIFGMVILNSFTIYLVYRLSLGLMSNRYALLSTLLFSLAPWAIYYSAGLYNPIPLALLGALLFLSLWQTTQHDQAKSIFWVCVLAAAIPQFHMIGVFYYPAILLLLLISPTKLNRRWFVFGIVVGLALYLPYLIGDYLHHWANTRNMLSGNSHFSSGILKVLTIPIAMLTNHPGQWAGYSTAELKKFGDAMFGSYVLLLIFNILSLGMAFVFVFGFLRRFIQSMSATGFRLRQAFAQYSSVMFVGVLFVLPLLFYMLTGRSYTTRYSILIFPLLFIIPALYLSLARPSRTRRTVISLLPLMLIVNVYLCLSFYHFQAKRIESSSTFHASFHKLATVYRALKTATGDNARIELSTDKYIKSNDKYSQITGNALRDYVDAYETYIAGHATSNKVITYTVLPLVAAVQSGQTLVYHDSAIGITR